MALLRDNIMAERQHGVKVVHIRFEGRSLDVPQGISMSAMHRVTTTSRTLARYLETLVAVPRLRDRSARTGNMTVRKQCSLKGEQPVPNGTSIQTLER
jgi:hypothetical protein